MSDAIERLSKLGDQIQGANQRIVKELEVLEPLREAVLRIGVVWDEGILFHEDGGTRYILITARNKSDRKMGLRVKIEPSNQDDKKTVSVGDIPLAIRQYILGIVDKFAEEYEK